MKFSILEQPRALNLSSFSWDDNTFSRLFRSCGGSDGFTNIWNQKRAFQQESSSSWISPASRNSAEVVPSQRKRQQPNKLPALCPVSKKSRATESDVTQVVDAAEGDIDDKEFEKYFIGIDCQNLIHVHVHCHDFR